MLQEGERPSGRRQSIRAHRHSRHRRDNLDLGKAVAERSFRRDLYYRFSVLVIRVPPLRERREDIPLLASNFLQPRLRAARQENDSVAAGRPNALTAYDWPGNVRQLENAIEYLVLFARGSSIEVDDLPPPFERASGRPVTAVMFQDLPTLAELEKAVLPARARCRRRKPDARGAGPRDRPAHALPHGRQLRCQPQRRVTCGPGPSDSARRTTPSCRPGLRTRRAGPHPPCRPGPSDPARRSRRVFRPRPALRGATTRRGYDCRFPTMIRTISAARIRRTIFTQLQGCVPAILLVTPLTRTW